MQRVEPVVAGLFYPKEKTKLQQMIRTFLQKSRQSSQNQAISALIVPHAGYIYSGQTAADAYRLIEGKAFSRVIVIGPAHRHWFEGVAIYKNAIFSTPLGEIESDDEFMSRLEDEKVPCAHNPLAFAKEHSVEVHYPFLQECISTRFSVVPVVIGDISSQTLELFSKKLKTCLKESSQRTIVIISTDFSHFHDHKTAQKMDKFARNLILNADPEKLIEANRVHEASLCGIYPVALAKKVFTSCTIEFISASHSGETTGDLNRVVGYQSFVIYPKE